ncbi:MAG TPA: 3-dehydroquinate synthase [Pirellulaceae bacterium]|nr:3-dehydroquinate synthase [Pirellulaceae bacterium]
MTAAATTVRVNLRERSYDITIGTHVLADAGAVTLARGPVSHCVLITDENVQPRHAQTVADSLAEAGINVDLLVVPAGEESKSIEVANELWQAMLAAGTDRKSWVVAVGGGVIGDLAGFMAATYARGLSFLQVPTTLLADVDSSVGGKVGVNLPGAKNMVGAFWQPAAVLIDTQALTTLPEREYLSGLAEIVKYGMILDADFLSYLEAHANEILAREPASLTKIIARSCELKAAVVEQDEREETGLRAVLNYGHTFAHAIEAVAGYGEYLHGEAVAIGMQCAARLAAALGRIPREVVDRQERLLLALRLPVSVPKQLDEAALLAAMQHDKKVEHGRLRFVLPTKIGHVELVGGIESKLVREAFAPSLAVG